MIWKAIEGTKYEVSDEGLVRNSKTGRRMATDAGTAGVLKVSLSENNVKFRYAVHRLVAQAFLPDFHHSRKVMKMVGDRDNNRADNLYMGGPVTERNN